MSESARNSTAASAKFRVAYPNSTPRSASLIGLDTASERLVAEAAARLPERRRVVAITPAPGEDWLETLPARTKALMEAAGHGDIVVVVAHAAATAPRHHDALLEAYRLRSIPITALVVAPPGAPEADIATILAVLRPYARMAVVSADPDYIEDMLQALRA